MDEIQGFAPQRPAKAQKNVSASSAKAEKKTPAVESITTSTTTIKELHPSQASSNNSLPEPPKRCPKLKNPQPAACPVCSLENDSAALTCMACANVLNKVLVHGFWTCTSEACVGSLYVNAGDAGVCGVCGVDRRRS